MPRTVLAASLAAFSTSALEPQAVLRLPVAATVGERWLILASCLKRSGHNDTFTVWRVDELRPLDEDGDLTLEQVYERDWQQDGALWRAQTVAAIWRPGSTGTIDLEIRAYTLLETAGIALEDIALVAIKMTANDLTAESSGQLANSTTTFSRRASLAIPTGITRTYLAVYYMGYSNGTLNYPTAQIKLLHKNAQAMLLNPANAYYRGSLVTTPFIAFRRLAAVAGDLQAIEFASTGGGNQVWARNSLVALLDLASFEATAFREEDVDTVRNVDGWQGKGTLGFTGVPVRHLMLASAIAAPRASTPAGGDQLTRLMLDGVQLEEASGSFARTGAGPLQSDYPISRVRVITPASGGHNLQWQISRSIAGVTAHLRNSAFFMLQVDATANINRVTIRDRLDLNDSSRPRYFPGGKVRAERNTALLRESPSKKLAIWRRN